MCPSARTRERLEQDGLPALLGRVAHHRDRHGEQRAGLAELGRPRRRRRVDTGLRRVLRLHRPPDVDVLAVLAADGHRERDGHRPGVGLGYPDVTEPDGRRGLVLGAGLPHPDLTTRRVDRRPGGRRDGEVAELVARIARVVTSGTVTRASCAPLAIEPVPLAGTMLSDSRVGSAVNVHVNDTAADAGWLSTG